jgi:Ca-activated chloride channel family protein
VNAKVVGVIAEVHVTQTYVNRGTRPIHARYIFPGSTRAAVHGMTMTIGDHRIVARIKEREAARAEHQRAVQEGKTSSLLEQSRPNVFSMSVGNVLPGDRVEIELTYTELLVSEAHVYEFVFPTVVGPRYSTEKAEGAPTRDEFLANPYLREGTSPKTAFDIQLALDTGVALRDLACPSHKTTTDWKGPTIAVVHLDPAESGGGNRDFIVRYRLAGDGIASGLLLYPGAEEGFFLLMAQPPARVVADELPPRDYVFVVDVSGSMGGFPLDTAKRLLRDLIGGLKPTDTFNVILFSGTSHVMSPRSVTASPEHIADAIRVIDRQRGGGGTELYAALDEAVRLPRAEVGSRSIVLVTDGYIGTEGDVFGLIQSHLSGTNFFAFGIGSSVNRHLIEGVAKAGQGEPFVVTGPREAPAIAARFRRYIESPVLTQISVTSEGFDTQDLEPAVVPDLLADRPLIVLGKWRGEATGRIVVHGQTGLGPYHRVIDVSRVAPSTDYRALAHLWARARVARLSDYGTDAQSAAHRDAIVDLGLKYDLLTAFTSFIAVHEVVRNPGGDGENVAQPLPLPEGVSNAAVGMAQGAEPELIWVLGALGSIALALRARARRAR